MPPSKEACKALETYETTKAQTRKVIRDAKIVINKIIDTYYKIKYGIIDLVDVLGAELLSAIESVAASIAATALTAASSAASAALTAILNELLKIILAAPSVLFSLVAIPQKQAIEAADREGLFLSKANSNFQTILTIILKWTSGANGSQYYSKMREAMPYITKSLSLISDMIRDLDKDHALPGETRNATMSQSKYSQLQFNLNRAIIITKPSSVITLNLNAIIESETQTNYRKLALTIDNDYDVKRKNIASNYFNSVKNLSSSIRANQTHTGDNIIKSAQIEKASAQYSLNLNIITAERKQRLAEAMLKAKDQAVLNSSTYVKAAEGIVGEFSFDMQTLVKSLDGLYKNVSQAFVQYKLCQLMCYTVYNIKNVIRNIINEIIDLLRQGTNSVADVIVEILTESQATIQTVSDIFIQDMNKFERSGISSIQLSTDLLIGNTLLEVTDAGLKATINKKLIDLINSDDLLQDMTKEFDDFIQRMRDIPDWNGGKGTWCTESADIVSAIPSPYIQLVADISSALLLIPSFAISGGPSDKSKVSNLLVKSRSAFRKLLNHNSIVHSTLNSYTAYTSAEYGNLIRFLSNSGLLQNFAVAMSLVTLITGLSSDLLTNFSVDSVNRKNCHKAYPEMFNDDELALSAVMNESNIPPPHISSQVKQANEERMPYVYKFREVISTYDDNSDSGFNTYLQK